MEGGLTYERAYFAITMECELTYEQCWGHNLLMQWVVVAGGVSPSSLHKPQLATWVSCGTSYASSYGTTLILNLLGLTSKWQAPLLCHLLAWELGFLVVISIGMVIFVRSVDTRPGLTLMDRVLSSPIKNRVGFRVFFFFFLKKTLSGFGSIMCFAPNPTRLQLK